jgi:hypothetical protein
MTCNKNIGCAPQTSDCVDEYGCGKTCPDFVIRRHDNKPPFKLKIEDCDGPMDLTGLVVEATMWAKAKLKTAITASDEYFALADNIGFHQIMVGDIIVIDRPRLPEQMLVIAFDEVNRLVQVQRGYHGTQAQAWKKGQAIRIMKFINAEAQSEMIYQDVLQIDGTISENQLMDSFFIYDWQQNDTCLPGCYYLEFKLIKMSTSEMTVQSVDAIIPSFTSPDLTSSDFGCGLGVNVEWIRRFPIDSEGFLIRIFDSPTSESL